jgi:hypothetical protein
MSKKNYTLYPRTLADGQMINSVLHTKAAESAISTAKADLEVPDPAPNVAKASIEAHFPSGNVNR